MTTGKTTSSSSSVVAKKSLGQHWLVDSESLEYICDAAKLTDKDIVLEIGPGTGNLTKLLLTQVKKVIAIELDENLSLRLDQLNLPNLEVINEDILKFNFKALPKNYKIVANIPYYLTGKLIRLISETPNRPSLAILLVQKEIAERMSASPGSMSILGIISQYYWNVSKGMIITADKFDPSPKVDSQVICLESKTGLPLTEAQLIEFFKLVRIGFASKRKTLLNNLSSGYNLSKPELIDMLSRLNIDPGRRSQTLNLDEWLFINDSFEGVVS